MAASCQVRQAMNWKSPHDLLVTFAIDLVTFCDHDNHVELKIASIDTIWALIFFELELLTTPWLPTAPICVLWFWLALKINYQIDEQFSQLAIKYW